MIAADHIAFDGDTAWLVMEHLEAWLGLKDRPCVTCTGTGLVPFGLPSNGPERCPDCIDGRHTFEIEVECPHDCRRFGGNVPGFARGSNWDWVPCWCNGTFLLTHRV